jgi:hypothetical protein
MGVATTAGATAGTAAGTGGDARPAASDATLAEQLVRALAAADLLDRRAAARLLGVRLRQPQSYVTLAGETSTGKSTLLNALLGENLLPVDAPPTTGLVTQVVLNGAAAPRFFLIRRDATQEERGRDDFRAALACPPADVLRAQVRCPAPAGAPRGLNVFDTPGFNSLVERHGAALREFLPHSDVVVFVVGHRTGFGAADRALLELVRGCTAADPELPILLAVNRVPPGAGPGDERVAEMLAAVTDCLGGARPELLLVPAVPPPPDDTPEAEPPIPDAGALWRRVAQIVDAPERRVAVRRRLRGALLELVRDADAALARRELAIAASAEEVALIRERRAALAGAQQGSLEAIDETMGRLETLVPALVRRAVERAQEALAADIARSGKWTGAEDCTAWLTGHALPFAVRGVARAVEELVGEELRRLDERLAEYGNAAVMELGRDIQVRGSASADFLKSLALTLGRRLGGQGVQAIFRGVGGVGGAAAGSGNVVKMIVSRVGRLFGKTFSREVYNQIGRTFTKRFLARLNVAVVLVVEVVGLFWEVHHWQGRVTERIRKALDEWAEQATEDLLREQLPASGAENRAGVVAVYGPLLADLDRDLAARETATDADRARLRALRAELADIAANIERLPAPHEGQPTHEEDA